MTTEPIIPEAKPLTHLERWMLALAGRRGSLQPAAPGSLKIAEGLVERGFMDRSTATTTGFGQRRYDFARFDLSGQGRAVVAMGLGR